ncbi:MAG: hypothetical protein OSJ74_00955 [Clostridia bacterium]|nr:hypothetical protein [Clostridia bacterium]
MMNIIIGALTTSAKLTACLAVLLILIIIEIATFVVLFIWRKKSMAAQPTESSSVVADAPQLDANTATQSADSVVETSAQEPAAQTQETSSQADTAVVTETTGNADAQQGAQEAALQSVEDSNQQSVTQTEVSSLDADKPSLEQTDSAEANDGKKKGGEKTDKLAAFMFAPFMLFSASTNIAPLRGAVYAFVAISMLLAVGAVVTAAIFASQISKKPIPKPVEQPQQPVQPVEEEPLVEQPVQEVVEPSVEEPVAEEPPVEETVAAELEPTVEEASVEQTQEPVVVEEVVATFDEGEEAEEDEDDEAEEEEESRIFVETDDGGYFIILDKSFTARIIQSKKQVKEYYSHIKNALLSFKKVNARMSKKRESFRFGKATIARLAIRGKTLRLYLALDPSKYTDSKYKIEDQSNIMTFADTPLLLRVNSERKCEYAIELIEDLAAKFKAVFDGNFEEVDYVAQMPYESVDALVDKGLIIKKLAKGKSLFDSKVVDVLDPADDDKDSHVSVDSDPISDEDSDVADLYERSLTAKLMQADVSVKQYYSVIKNHLLSYKKVNVRMTKKREVFRFGKDVIARISLRSKTLRLYLALEFKDYKDGKYLVEDASQVKAVEDTPVLYRIANERRSRFAKELIDDMLVKLGAEREEKAAVDYASELPYRTDEELFHQGLIVVRNVAGASVANKQDSAESQVAADKVEKPKAAKTAAKTAKPKTDKPKASASASKTDK